MTEIQVNPGWLKDGKEPEWLTEFRRVQFHIENALEYNSGTVALQDIVDQIAVGEMHLWTAEDSAVITHFVEFPRALTLHIPFAGGNLKELEAILPSVINFAKAANCNMVTVAGRRGWERSFLKDADFRPAYQVLKMDIHHG